MFEIVGFCDQCKLIIEREGAIISVARIVIGRIHVRREVTSRGQMLRDG
jgi:hypothetical protein